MTEDLLQRDSSDKGLFQTLYSYQQNNILCDVQIYSSDGCIPAHRVILTATCPYFRSFEESKSGSCKNYIFSTESTGNIGVVLKYLYTGVLEVTENNFEKVYGLCCSLKLPQAVAFMKKKYAEKCEIISIENSSRRSQADHKISNSSNDKQEWNNPDNYIYFLKEIDDTDNTVLSETSEYKHEPVNIEKILIKDEIMNISNTEDSVSSNCPSSLTPQKTSLEDCEKSVEDLTCRNETCSNSNQTFSSKEINCHTSDKNKSTGNESDLEQEENGQSKVDQEAEQVKYDQSQQGYLSRKRNRNVKSNQVKVKPEENEETDCIKMSDEDYSDGDMDFGASSEMESWEKSVTELISHTKIKNKNEENVSLGNRNKNNDLIKATKNLSKKKGKCKFVCRTCKEEFSDEKSKKKHVETQHSGNYLENHTCDKCGKMFSPWKLLINHKFTSHGIPYDIEKYQPSYCSFPGCTYSNLVIGKVNYHYRRCHERPETCGICGKTFPSGRPFKLHINSHSDEKKFSCEKCGSTFKLSSTLKNHIKHVHEGIEKPTFMCHLCPNVYTTKFLVELHILKDHKQIPAGKEKLVRKCHLCDFVTFKPSYLKKHLLLHKEYKDESSAMQKVSCEVCGKLFKTSEIKHHIKNVHGEKKKCPYEGCNFSNCSKRRLDAHIFNMHTNKNVKPFACHLCSYRCKVRGNLTKHFKHQHDFIEMTLAKKRKLALETGVAYPTTIEGNTTSDINYFVNDISESKSEQCKFEKKYPMDKNFEAIYHSSI